jgi:DNA-binding response OmpR family regulator
VLQPVLIVEDDAALRTSMRILLRRSGHAEVLAARTLGEAMRFLETAVPSHAIIDLNLPDGLGIDLLRQIRLRGLATRVMILTGSPDTYLHEQARQIGAERVIQKPPDWKQLADWTNTSQAAPE